jgi:hypothetical protein
MVDQLDNAADPGAPYMDQLLLLLRAEERRRDVMVRIQGALPARFRPVNRAWDDLVALVAARVESEVDAVVEAVASGSGGQNPSEYLFAALRAATPVPNFLDVGNFTDADGTPCTSHRRAYRARSQASQWQDWNAWEGDMDYHGAGHPYAACPIQFMSSHFFTELRGGNTGAVEGRWTRQWRFFNQRLVVIPINWEDYHWAICFVFPGLKRVRYYDSMGGGARSPEVKTTLMTYMHAEAARAGDTALCKLVREAQFNALTHSTDSICYCALPPFPQFPERVVV